MVQVMGDWVRVFWEGQLVGVAVALIVGEVVLEGVSRCDQGRGPR